MDRGGRHIPGVLKAAALAAVLVAGPSPAPAGIRSEGYYRAEVSAEKSVGKWHLGYGSDNGMPRHFGEFKFFADPSDRVSMFARIWAASNRDDEQTPRVDFYFPSWINGEGHVQLRRGNAEAFLFYRQNRFFINDEPLLHLVDDNKLKNDNWGPQATGVRADFWEGSLFGIKNLGGTLILSDNGGTYQTDRTVRDAFGNIAYARDDNGEIKRDEEGNPIRLDPESVPVLNGDDNKILRLRHKAWGNRLESAVMYLRKDWTDTSRDDWRDLIARMYNDVFSFDVAFTPRNIVETGLRLWFLDFEQSRWTTQLAWSRRPYQEFTEGASRHRARAIAFEVRDIHAGDLTLHAWYNDFGEDFRAYMSNRFDEGNQFNKVETHAEAIWLVPLKAVTTKIAWTQSRKRLDDDPAGGGLQPSTEWYAELYMEFINGFRARFAYRNWRGYDASVFVNDFQTYPDWFGEISVENFLAKIRLQGRIHDAGTFRQTTSYGFDMGVNLTDRLTGYLRALNVNEKTKARHTGFAQLKYLVGNNAEIYVEYGDPDHSDNLVYNGFTNEIFDDNPPDLSDRFKLTVTTWY